MANGNIYVAVNMNNALRSFTRATNSVTTTYSNIFIDDVLAIGVPAVGIAGMNFIVFIISATGPYPLSIYYENGIEFLRLFIFMIM